MSKKMLLLGASGKMGTALSRHLQRDYRIIPKTSRDFDALDFEQTRQLIQEIRPDYIINSVAFMGIDPCEKNPDRAYHLNGLFPKLLASLAREHGSVLVHFSTDAVFDGNKGSAYHERDLPSPLNLYGATKLVGDSMVRAYTSRYYIFRLPILFGPSPKGDQLTERLLGQARAGKPLRVAHDIVGSPSYTLDIAAEIHRILSGAMPFGLYHLNNKGQASLYELMAFLLRATHREASLEKASHLDFPTQGLRATLVPLTSVKLTPLRDWRVAAADYVRTCWDSRHLR